MRVASTGEAPERSRNDGIVSYILHTERDVPETDLTISWVDLEPGATQPLHDHDAEQAYVVVTGEGRMHVGGEERSVSSGDLIHIPPNADHGIENTGERPLTYVSVSTAEYPLGMFDRYYEK